MESKRKCKSVCEAKKSCKVMTLDEKINNLMVIFIKILEYQSFLLLTNIGGFNAVTA
jgi:hypothetical protein